MPRESNRPRGSRVADAVAADRRKREVIARTQARRRPRPAAKIVPRRLFPTKALVDHDPALIRPATRHFATELRARLTPAERALWKLLVGQRMGVAFCQQIAIFGYIADVYFPAAGLVVEVDGAVHDSPEAKAKDAERTFHLESHGLKVVRFSNAEVLEQPRRVRERIHWAIRQQIRLVDTPPRV